MLLSRPGVSRTHLTSASGSDCTGDYHVRSTSYSGYTSAVLMCCSRMPLYQASFSPFEVAAILRFPPPFPSRWAQSLPFSPVEKSYSSSPCPAARYVEQINYSGDIYCPTPTPNPCEALSSRLHCSFRFVFFLSVFP